MKITEVEIANIDSYSSLTMEGEQGSTSLEAWEIQYDFCLIFLIW